MKKAKLELKEDPEAKELEEKIAKQNAELFKYRDKIQKEKMKKDDMIAILEENDQDVPEGDTLKLLNLVCDVLTFGALKRCKKCKTGQYVFNKSGYICTGDLSEWVKCANLEKDPPRKPCVISRELKEQYSFLKKYKGKVQTRAIKYVPPSAPSSLEPIKKEEDLDG